MIRWFQVAVADKLEPSLFQCCVHVGSRGQFLTPYQAHTLPYYSTSHLQAHRMLFLRFVRFSAQANKQHVHLQPTT